MHRSSSERVSNGRALWLVELAGAIDEAQRLAWRIGFTDGTNAEAMDLYQRLETARVEVESLRRSPWAACLEEIAPEWMNFLPDSLNCLDPATEG